MRFNIYFFLSQLMIFYSQYRLISVNAMIGHNIRQAGAREYSYVVSLMRIEPGHPHSGGEHYCTGTLVSRKDVLTAAHCLEDEDLNTTQILVGTIDLRNGSLFYPYWWITYNQWIVAVNISDTYGWNDIANIRLTETVPSNILYARLSRLENTDLFNAQAKIVGWGLNNDNILPDVMNYATVQIIENSVCESRIARIVHTLIPVDSRVLCSVVSPFALVEYGDSGGPFIFGNKLVAVNHGTCPISHGARPEEQVNLHFGIYFYRPFVNYMKNQE